MYFESKGKANTAETCKLAVEYAEKHGIRHIVVASNTGYTVEKLLSFLAEDSAINVVCVTHHVGFRNPGEDEMSVEMRNKLSQQGVKLLTTTHLMAGIERAAMRKFGGIGVHGLVAYTLRMFGQGMKVCAEIAPMALDAGLIPYGEDIIAIGGSGRGADTAVVLRPEHSHTFFDMEIKEIICKPRSIR